MGLDAEIGSLEVGKKADLAILDLRELRSWPQAGVNRPSILVYSAGARDVVTTVVDGKVVWDRENPTGIQDLRDQTARAIQRVRERAETT